MKFCTQCDNMYYISINNEDSNKLTYYCRNCGYIDPTLSTQSLCVLNNQLKHGIQTVHHIVNKYNNYDPTLPRIYNIKCPNGECNTNKDTSTPAEIIYMRYDDSNLKYLYICSTCDTKWNT